MRRAGLGALGEAEPPPIAGSSQRTERCRALPLETLRERHSGVRFQSVVRKQQEETLIFQKHISLVAGVSSIMNFSSLWIYIFHIFYQKTYS